MSSLPQKLFVNNSEIKHQKGQQLKYYRRYDFILWFNKLAHWENRYHQMLFIILCPWFNWITPKGSLAGSPPPRAGSLMSTEIKRKRDRQILPNPALFTKPDRHNLLYRKFRLFKRRLPLAAMARRTCPGFNDSAGSVSE